MKLLLKQMLSSVATSYGSVDLNEILGTIEELITEKRKRELKGRINHLDLASLQALLSEVRSLNDDNRKNGKPKPIKRGRPKMSRDEHLQK